MTTTPDTPAETIARAATRLRELATAATEIAPTPWSAPDNEIEMQYIAAMDPTVGHALAAWLHSWASDGACVHPLPPDAGDALTIARLILGSPR